MKIETWLFVFYASKGDMIDLPGLAVQIETALADLKLERASILHPGSKRYPVHDQVEALPLAKLDALVETVMGWQSALAPKMPDRFPR